MKPTERRGAGHTIGNRLETWIVFAALGAFVACSTAPNGSAGAGDASVGATGPGSSSSEGGAGFPASPDGGAVGDDDDGGVQPSSDGGLVDAAPPPPVDAAAYGEAGADTTVVAFSNTLVCFGSGGTGPCSRTVDAPVTFPTSGAFSSVLMHVTLNCPTNGCDPWDRAGSIDLVKEPAVDGGAETLIELGRFMTPYGISAGVNAPPAWDIDVTELRPAPVGHPALAAPRLHRHVGPAEANAAQYGGGWVVGTSFVM